MALTVIAHITAKEEFTAQVETALTQLLEPTRKEDGCIRYVLYKSTEAPHVFLMYEVWRDRPSFERHNEQLHLQLFVTQAKGWLSKEMEVEVF